MVCSDGQRKCEAMFSEVRVLKRVKGRREESG